MQTKSMFLRECSNQSNFLTNTILAIEVIQTEHHNS